ncbi:hypothetical protein V6L77_00720 [Pannonibacter sp. Pt2-lr]
MGSGTTTNSPSYDSIDFVSRHVLRIRCEESLTRYAIDASLLAQTVITRNNPGTNLVFGGLVGAGSTGCAMSYIVFVNGLLGDVAAAEMLKWALARRNL